MLALAPVVAATATEAAGRNWPDVILTLGVAFVAFLIFVSIFAIWFENRKVKLTSTDQEAIRQLVDRYEQLAEKTMDAQQRIATDLAELRPRLSAIEQILRTVE